jgi:UPF0042 nucleotide-binding protein
LLEALDQEQRLLVPLANDADLTIDTSRLSVHELRELVREGLEKQRRPCVTPLDDARALPNPYWHPSLRELTGRDDAVAAFLDGQEDVGRFFGDIRDFLERWLPSLVRSNRSYLTIAVGCTGGQHRSVYLAEKLAAYFNGHHGQTLIRHRDLTSRRHE